MTLYAYDGGRVGTMQSWPCPTRSPAKNVTPNPASITLGLDFEDFEGRLRGLRGTGTCEKMRIRDFNGLGIQEFVV